MLLKITQKLLNSKSNLDSSVVGNAAMKTDNIHQQPFTPMHRVRAVVITGDIFS